MSRENKKKGYLTITFGCQMNEHDSEVIAAMLEKMGYSPVEDKLNADIIVVNTCCIRETAENKVFGLLGRLRKIKESNPNLIIAMGGCMSQQEGMGKRIKERFRYVDIVFGTHNVNKLPEFIAQASEKRRQVIEVWSSAPEEMEDIPDRRISGPRAWVCIMYGCNNFCTYCIVPYVRGRERSRNQHDIVNEIKNMVGQGVKEVTLLGQNVNSYGKDLDSDVDFSDLLVMLENIEGLERIRFMTSHPRDFSDKLISTLSGSKKVCEHIHLPVQSGSSTILKHMNRGYDREDYLRLVHKIKGSIPGVSLTTDIIIGFPGENEKDFWGTMDLVRQVKFDGGFVFVYNKRSGTPAAKMSQQVPDEIKSKRIQDLIAMQNEFTLESNEREVGKVLEVLVEGKSKTRDDRLSGRTRSNKLVMFDSDEDLTGKLVSVKITDFGLTHLGGELVFLSKDH